MGIPTIKASVEKATKTFGTTADRELIYFWNNRTGGSFSIARELGLKNHGDIRKYK